ncbi:MAG: D-alanine--D-alanine ligase [Chromatiales bacterium]|nr:MAG: D-alanine--D-alanine ligase [Chromatiales bacterium]
MTAPRYLRVTEPAAFGRVVVLMGGQSAEREISLLTGAAVLKALRNKGVNAEGLDAGPDLLARLTAGNYDRVWIALHGRGGEDGTLQGLLSFLGLPFTGSGVLGSAISMDKLRTKRLLQGAGLPTPRYCVIRNEADLSEAGEQLGLPVMVKPSDEGSSIGMTKVERPEQMRAAWELASGFACDVLAEEWVAGPEYTAAVLHDRVLPLVRIQTDSTFYDYQAKYFSDDTRYVCPCGLSPEREREIAEIARAAFEAVGAAGWGRVDIMVSPQAGPLILEINTVPGMTSHSLVPMAAAAAGTDFDELVWRILETSMESVAEVGRQAGAGSRS